MSYPSGLTASAFEAMIHYYYTPEDMDGASDRGSLAYKAIKCLEGHGLIEVRSDGDDGCWRLTERGNCMALHILYTPLPVQHWSIPSSTVNSDQP